MENNREAPLMVPRMLLLAVSAGLGGQILPPMGIYEGRQNIRDANAGKERAITSIGGLIQSKLDINRRSKQILYAPSASTRVQRCYPSLKLLRRCWVKLAVHGHTLCAATG
ncbi:unnamed protein product [Prorocentrum cordatum]|uniref:PS II complex 12 kDa extrinsic protein n=1 Tax=Prorocentrum cordatum TaxID=2364126 RepID=A0ABN9Q0Z2_9DINO|nr:unnamed protein product [Polarella glacialis]